jgi:hypothetical protein
MVFFLASDHRACSAGGDERVPMFRQVIGFLKGLVISHSHGLRWSDVHAAGCSVGGEE